MVTTSTFQPDESTLLNGWVAGQLKDCCEIFAGGRRGWTKEKHYRPSGFPAFSAAGQDGYVEQFEHEGDAVILSAIGANCGRCFFTSGKWSTLANVQAIVPPRDKLDARYLFYYVNRDGYWPRSGSAQPFIKPSDIGKAWVAFPENVEQQRKIAAILEIVDGAIEQTEALIAKCQRIKTGLMQDLLTRGIDEHGHLRNPAIHKFKLSTLGSIPETWDIRRLEDATLKIQDGTHFSPKSSEGPYRYLTSKNIRFGFLDISDCAWISREEHEGIYARCDVKKGDLLLTKDGANTGNAAMNTLDEPFSLLSSVALIRCDNEDTHAQYILHYILSQAGRKRIKDLMSGNAIPRITVRKIKEFEIPFPPGKEQKLIADILNAHDSATRAEERRLDKLKHLKAGLIQDLLTGNVSVEPLLETQNENLV